MFLFKVLEKHISNGKQCVDLPYNDQFNNLKFQIIPLLHHEVSRYGREGNIEDDDYDDY